MAIESSHSKKIRPPWDKRTWIVGSVGGLSGAGMLAGGVAASGDGLRISSAAQNAGLLGALITFCLLPSVLAAIARRRWLLWPYLPTVIFLVVMMVVANVVPAPPYEGSEGSVAEAYKFLAVLALLPIACSSPVLIYRWQKAAQKRTKLRAIASEQLAATDEDVWPPRPRVDG